MSTPRRARAWAVVARRAGGPVTLAALIAFAAFITLAAPGCGGKGSRPRARNVLLITLDTTRADHLGLYGYGKATSPNIDGLAPQATVFDMAIAQAAVTPVSHASILTGLNPYHHGLRVLHGHEANKLASDKTTLAEVWQQAGGETAAFVSAYPVTAGFGFEQGFEHFDADFPNSDGAGLTTPEGWVNTGQSQRRADATTDRAIAWLQQRTDPKKPLLLWVHYFDPHDPALQPPENELSAWFRDLFRPVTTGKIDVLRSIYDAEIRYMDSQLGRLLREYMRLGLWDETLVVIVADHGEGLGDHNWWGHGVLYQEQIRVPLIIRVPGLAAGTRVGSLVRSIDLMPTMLAGAGVDAKLWPAMDGVSLLPLMQTGKSETALTAYADAVNLLTYQRPYDAAIEDRRDDKLYCLIDGSSKLIYHQLRPDQSELYDLARDPLEQRNLAATEGATLTGLKGQLIEREALSDIMPGATPTDRERMERLRSLGYIQ
jgi:arylsulfatase A-like enzyme